ncbi:trypsin-like peptidase domain-containing protein [Acidithiobacillus sp. HP-11]|uniref:trypsin-like peptidase domain-containing protein n=1 Tax=Acidithiobacillus sp. HP-11 TaxID=2697656 RepID=UPI0018797C4C|nr:trypsin-like peptidase domain-containing protein [Acidithiobacillus sp. HP-11]MBE7566415.1 trypsin-like peptidase domain-containing protein [Acidithiobacillus sp. HP-11]
MSLLLHPRINLSIVIAAALTMSACAQTTTPLKLSPTNASPTQSALVTLPNFAPVMNKVGPAVVNISSTSVQSGYTQQSQNPFSPDSPLYELYQQFLRSQRPFITRHQQVESLGSGFIISTNGYIITAAHVVKGASNIVVTLTDHKAYHAHLVGLSVRYDTALLKIQAHHLPTVTLGNAHRLRVGEWVLAIGAPFGLNNTLTQGVVGALQRPLPSDLYIPFIQTDVPINPGSSGGPLLNMAGQVVGINDQIYTEDGGYMGLSFSIPINTALRAVQAIKNHQPLQFGWLGVAMQSVTPEMAEALHLKEPIGALLDSVEPGGPAQVAGLQRGDVIQSFNGYPIDFIGQLPILVGQTPPGATVPIGIIRNGKSKTIEVRVGIQPEAPRIPPSAPMTQITRLNLQVVPLDAQIKKALQIDYGVIVIKVRHGPAQTIGIRPGMLIKQIAGQDIRTPEQLKHLVATLPAKKPIPILIQMGQDSTFLTIELP